MDFSKIEGLDEDQQKALKLLTKASKFTEFVSSSLKNRETAIRESAEGEYKPKLKELRDTNVDVLKKLKAFDGFDADEYKKLKAVGTDTEKHAKQLAEQQKEYEAKLQAVNDKAKESEKRALQAEETNENNAFEFKFLRAIDKHNENNPTHEVTPVANARAQMIRDAGSMYKKSEDGKYIMLNSDGSEFTDDSGFGSMESWIGNSYLKDNSHMIKQQEGSNPDGNTGTTAEIGNRTSQERIAGGLGKLNIV